jgi:hypothetical protein
MGDAMESAIDDVEPCPAGNCDSADDCTCWSCDICDSMQSESDSTYGEGAVCEDCWDSLVTCCDECGRSVTIDYQYGGVRRALGVHEEVTYTDDNMSVCSECVYVCETCEATFSCEESRDDCCGDSATIHDYSYRPSPLFWRMGIVPVTDGRAEPRTLYVGVEIEAEKAADTADQFLADAGEEAGEERFVYLKRDGSLGDGGVEIVTHPATPEAFLERFPFDAVEKWTGRGARSYHRPACGFHIHVSRSAFSPSHLWRFVRFQLANVEHCINVAQRNSEQWANWSGDGMDEVKKSLPSMVKGRKRNGSRYVAINFQNRDTVELRYFKGNLSPRIIRRQVLFVSAMYHYTRTLTVVDVRGGAFDWGRFVAWVDADLFHRSIAADLSDM